MSDLALGDLRLKVAQMLLNPYTRHKGFVLSNQYKSSVKKFCRKLSNKVQSSVHYTVDQNLVDLVSTSLQRRSTRHFVNACNNFMPPHRDFFVEWQKEDTLFGVHAFTEQRTMSASSVSNHIVTTESETRRKEVTSIVIYIGHDSGCSFVPVEFWFDPEGDQAFGTYAARIFFSSFFDLDRFGPKPEDLPEDIRHALYKVHWQPQVFVDGYEDFRLGMNHQYQVDPLKCFKTEHELERTREGILTFISLVSLINYDWTVEREPGIIVDSVKSVNTSGVAKDQYKQVKLNLPKSKQVLDFFKQKPRTRKFGTAEHVVRGHWRYYKRTGERVWIGEHTRGDSQYGTVHKDYLLTKRDNFLKQTA